MTDTGKLTCLDAAVRRAMLANSFVRSRTLLEQYGAEVERLLRAGPIGSEDAAQLAKRTRGLFEWLTIMARSSRTRLESELANARRISKYRCAAPRALFRRAQG